MTPTHHQITLAGKRFNVSRDAKGTCFIGDESAAAFVERMTLLGRQDVLDDLKGITKTKSARSAWAKHRAREREAGR